MTHRPALRSRDPATPAPSHPEPATRTAPALAFLAAPTVADDCAECSLDDRGRSLLCEPRADAEKELLGRIGGSHSDRHAVEGLNTLLKATVLSFQPPGRTTLEELTGRLRATAEELAIADGLPGGSLSAAAEEPPGGFEGELGTLPPTE